jgi:hypothetical protein
MLFPGPLANLPHPDADIAHSPQISKVNQLGMLHAQAISVKHPTLRWTQEDKLCTRLANPGHARLTHALPGPHVSAALEGCQPL